MTDLRPVSHHFRRTHAAKLRRVAGSLAKHLDTDCIEVALYLHNLADKIDEAFAAPSNVVPLRRESCCPTGAGLGFVGTPCPECRAQE